jgi:hypothetical protein
MALMNTMCDKLTACRPDVDLSRCRSAVSANEAMPSDLGLQPGSYNVYVDVMTAVDTKELNANQEALDACEATIQQYACTDEHVVDVNFFGTCNSNVEKMVDTEPGAGCPRVFAGQ